MTQHEDLELYIYIYIYIYKVGLFFQVPDMSESDHFGNILKIASYLNNKSLTVLRETPERDK